MSSFSGTLFFPTVVGVGLAACDKLTSSSDPYFRLVFPDGEKFKSHHFSNTLSPIWNGLTLKWSFQNVTADAVFQFEMWDYDHIGRDDLIGQASFRFHELVAKFHVEHELELNLRTPKHPEQNRGTAKLTLRLDCPDALNLPLFSSDTQAVLDALDSLLKISQGGMSVVRRYVGADGTARDRWGRLLQLASTVNADQAAAVKCICSLTRVAVDELVRVPTTDETWFLQLISGFDAVMRTPGRRTLTEWLLQNLEALLFKPDVHVPIEAQSSVLQRATILSTLLGVHVPIEARASVLQRATILSTLVDELPVMCAAAPSPDRDAALELLAGPLNASAALVRAVLAISAPLVAQRGRMATDPLLAVAWNGRASPDPFVAAAARLLAATYAQSASLAAAVNRAQLQELFAVWLYAPEYDGDYFIEVYRKLKDDFQVPFDEMVVFDPRRPMSDVVFAFRYPLTQLELLGACVPLQQDPMQVRGQAQGDSAVPPPGQRLYPLYWLPQVPVEDDEKHDTYYEFDRGAVAVMETRRQGPFVFTGAALRLPQISDWPGGVIQILACDRLPDLTDLKACEKMNSASLFFDAVGLPSYLHPAAYIDARTPDACNRFATTISQYLRPARYLVVRMHPANDAQQKHHVQALQVFGVESVPLPTDIVKLDKVTRKQLDTLPGSSLPCNVEAAPQGDKLVVEPWAVAWSDTPTRSLDGSADAVESNPAFYVGSTFYPAYWQANQQRWIALPQYPTSPKVVGKRVTLPEPVLPPDSGQTVVPRTTRVTYRVFYNGGYYNYGYWYTPYYGYWYNPYWSYYGGPWHPYYNAAGFCRPTFQNRFPHTPFRSHVTPHMGGGHMGGGHMGAPAAFHSPMHAGGFGGHGFSGGS